MKRCGLRVSEGERSLADRRGEYSATPTAAEKSHPYRVLPLLVLFFKGPRTLLPEDGVNHGVGSHSLSPVLLRRPASFAGTYTHTSRSSQITPLQYRSCSTVKDFLLRLLSICRIVPWDNFFWARATERSFAF